MLDSQIETVLARAARKVRKGTAKKNLAVGEGVRYSVIGEEGGDGADKSDLSDELRYYDIPWKEGLYKAVTDKSVREPVFVSETPEVLIKIGFTAMPMLMNVRHLRLNYYDRTDFEKNFGKMRQGEHAHNLRDKLKNLPEALKHPLAVVVNQTKNATPGSVVAITDMDINGKKVVVPVLIESVKTINNNDIDSHLVLTVYDSNNWMEQFLAPAIKAEKNGVGIFYFDANKASRYTAYSNKIGNIPTGFVHNIAEANIKVKSQTETLQFKKWFDGSKVVDESGKPMVVYHGTDADFYSFDTKNGAWFSRSMEYAESMMEERNGKNLLGCYLAIKNPMIVKADPQKFAADIAWEKSLIAEARTKGHDGLIIENNTDNDLEKDVFYVAFSPEQIKLAGNVDTNGELIPGTGNIGTFDPENPDIRFSLEEYSESEQEDITAVLRPFVGRNIDMEPGKYREYLKEKGILIPDGDADVFFRMAIRENDRAARERANKLRDQWIYENFPIFAEVAAFAGGSDFKIKPVGHEGEDFTGSFISPAYVKYSVKASQGKRSEKQYRKYLAMQCDPLFEECYFSRTLTMVTAQRRQPFSPLRAIASRSRISLTFSGEFFRVPLHFPVKKSFAAFIPAGVSLIATVSSEQVISSSLKMLLKRMILAPNSVGV